MLPTSIDTLTRILSVGTSHHDTAPAAPAHDSFVNHLQRAQTPQPSSTPRSSDKASRAAADPASNKSTPTDRPRPARDSDSRSRGTRSDTTSDTSPSSTHNDPEAPNSNTDPRGDSTPRDDSQDTGGSGDNPQPDKQKEDPKAKTMRKAISGDTAAVVVDLRNLAAAEQMTPALEGDGTQTGAIDSVSSQPAPQAPQPAIQAVPSNAPSAPAMQDALTAAQSQLASQEPSPGTIQPAVTTTAAHNESRSTMTTTAATTAPLATTVEIATATAASNAAADATTDATPQTATADTQAEQEPADGATKPASSEAKPPVPKPTPHTAPAANQPGKASTNGTIAVEPTAEIDATPRKDRGEEAIADLSPNASDDKPGSRTQTSGPTDARAQSPANATAAPSKSSSTLVSGDVTLSQADRLRFVQRVEQAFHGASTQGGTVRLRLSPPELGALKIDITVSRGEMSARVEADTPAARNLLLDNLPALRDRLAQHDIKIQRFDIDLMDRSSGGMSGQTSQYQNPSQQNDTPHIVRNTNRLVADTSTTAVDAVPAGTAVDTGRLNIVI